MHNKDRSDSLADDVRRGEDEDNAGSLSHQLLRSTGYRHYISQCIQGSSRALADDWLQRLKTVVNEETRDIFPTAQYLDHIPSMIEQMGAILDTGDSDLTMVNSVISQKALELGRLRHEQKATISQLLREYDLLAGLLAEHQIRWVDEFTGDAPVPEVLEVSDIISAVIRLILQYTVDAFTEKYMATIEEQTEKLVSFNHFVSHEIRSPLNSALLGIDLLRESGGFTAQQNSDIENVRHSLLEAASVVDSVKRLVALSEPVSIDSPVKQVLPLAALVSDLCLQLSDALEARGVTVHIPEDLGEVNLETGRLKLLLSNLLSNAIKYCDPAKPERKVWVSRHDHVDGSLQLTVKDNGLGIPAEQLNKVKGLRVRAHTELDDAHSVSGEGLGLYLVDEAMRELGGTVTLHSEPGEGTSVHLVFPAATS